MTVAVDIATGRVIGQVTSVGDPPRTHVTLLVRDGRYLIVPVTTVRLEEV